MVVETASQPPPADASGDAAAAAGNKKKPLYKKDAAAKEAEAELSEEDQELKEKLDLCVQRLSEVGDKPDNAAALAPAAGLVAIVAAGPRALQYRLPTPEKA